MRLLVVGLLLVASFAASLPPAAAQNVGPGASVAVNVDDPARSLPPGEEALLNVHGRYAVRAGGSVGEPRVDAEEGNGTQPTRIWFQVSQMPSWVTSAVVEPAELFIEPPVAGPLMGGERAWGGVKVRVTVAPDAPALQREPFVIEAIADQNGQIPSARAMSPELKLRATEIPRANVTVEGEAPHLVKGGLWNTIPFWVRNDGNRDTTILLNVTVRPEMSEVEFPKQVELAVGERALVEVRIRTPWTEREAGTLELEATPLTSDDVGPASRLAIDVLGQSAVPAPSPWAVLLVALGAVLLLRRARR